MLNVGRSLQVAQTSVLARGGLAWPARRGKYRHVRGSRSNKQMKYDPWLKNAFGPVDSHL